MKIKSWNALVLFTLLPLSAVAAKPNPFFLTKQRLMNRSAGLMATAKKKLEYFGGPVLGNARAIAVMWGPNVDAEVKAGISGMLGATLNSDYLDMLGQYSTLLPSVTGQPGTNQRLGRGTFGGQFAIQPANGSADLADADVGAELEGQIASGALPKPDANTLYLVYFPPGVSISLDGNKSCVAFCGYHHSVSTQQYGSVFYSVQPDLGGDCALGCGFGATSFDSMTIVTSHELAEAVTDPAVQPNADLGPPIAWVTEQGEEIGDLCAGQVTQLTAGATTYQLQQAFDNSTRSCNPGPFHAQ